MTTSGSTNQQVRNTASKPLGSSLVGFEQPTEDTFVLLDALEADADAIRSLAPRLCLEIGRVSSLNRVLSIILI